VLSQNGVPDFAELLGSAERSAVHLEMRDVYSVGNETESFEEVLRTGQTDLDLILRSGRAEPHWCAKPSPGASECVGLGSSPSR
jgi:hypothetical protein